MLQRYLVFCSLLVQFGITESKNIVSTLYLDSKTLDSKPPEVRRRTQGLFNELIGKIFQKRCSTNSPTIAPPPTSKPTASPVAAMKDCPNRLVRITRVCNVPSDLEDCFFCDYFDIRLFLESEMYWPQSTWDDCQWGSWVSGSCEVPMDEECFEIKNAKETNFNSPTTDLVMTLVETDGGGAEETFDMVFPSGWFNIDTCESIRTFTISAPNGATAEVEVRSSLSACGLEADIIENGLSDSALELEEAARVLSDYSNLSTRSTRSNKRMPWPILGMAARFGARFIGKRLPSSNNVMNAISGLADVTSIASNLKNIFGWGASSDDSDNQQSQLLEEFKNEVFNRLDQIDGKLDDLQTEMMAGFSSVEQFISDGFAKEELDDIINGRLDALENAYHAYTNPDQLPGFVQSYEDAFRQICLTDHPPYSVFKILYKHSCNNCDLMDSSGPAFQFMLDTFVSKANSLTTSLDDKILWFRSSFGRVILSAMIKLIYLHSVCLYQPSDLCQKDDVVWSTRLEEMGEALEEVAQSLSDAEGRIQSE